jgi:hypothetical protein
MRSSRLFFGAGKLFFAGGFGEKAVQNVDFWWLDCGLLHGKCDFFTVTFWR